MAHAPAAPLPASQEPAALDPAAWGSDHVGQPRPDYVVGDECLFCHRADVGPTWSRNRHQRTLRDIDRSSAAYTGLLAAGASPVREAQVEMGGERIVRYLRRSQRYGRYEILSHGFIPGEGGAPGRPGRLDPASAFWDEESFGRSCAGCHATAVDSVALTMSSPGLDCYTCHGAVDVNHPANTALVIFSRQRNHPAREVVSICGSCHVRTGRSRSSGLPYPNNFVPGDNLFRDLEVDLSAAGLAQAAPADRHVLENVRAVVLDGRDSVTCLTCHAVHTQSSKRHESLRQEASCLTCHLEDGPMSESRDYEDHSERCQY